MHADKIKTVIPFRTRNKKLRDLRQQQRNLQKTNQCTSCLAGITIPTKNRKIELNEMEARRKIKAMIT